MTSGKIGSLAGLLSMAAVTALAHSGATGIVLKRMNGMTPMRDIIG